MQYESQISGAVTSLNLNDKLPGGARSRCVLVSSLVSLLYWELAGKSSNLQLTIYQRSFLNPLDLVFSSDIP